MRILMLDGTDGTVACRVYGHETSSVLPQLSKFGTVECGLRSRLRMQNLVAVRGRPGASMVGPSEYIGNLESPHLHRYTIDASARPIPVIKRYPLYDATDLPIAPEWAVPTVDQKSKSAGHVAKTAFVTKTTFPPPGPSLPSASGSSTLTCSAAAAVSSTRGSSSVVDEKTISRPTLSGNSTPNRLSTGARPVSVPANVGSKKHAARNEKSLETAADPTPHVVTIGAKWISGREATEPMYDAARTVLGGSLFPNSGVLLVDKEKIDLPRCDATSLDLSSFRARLVPNHVPFVVTWRPLPKSDEYRAVTYFYEKGYGVQQQAEGGGGLFLERHPFSQAITPLHPHCSGFVTLARETKTANQLDLLAIAIPFGHTLLVDDDCIHGDATLVGGYCMLMTSNHVTMSLANTVFLKVNGTSKNVQMQLCPSSATQESETKWPSTKQPIDPLVIFKHSRDSQVDFLKRAHGAKFMFNPLSSGYWQSFSFPFQ